MINRERTYIHCWAVLRDSVCVCVCVSSFSWTSPIKYHSLWERNNNVITSAVAFGALSWIPKEPVKSACCLDGWRAVCKCYSHGHFRESAQSVLVSLVQTYKIWEWWSYMFMKNNWSKAIKSGMMTMVWISKLICCQLWGPHKVDSH